MKVVVDAQGIRYPVEDAACMRHDIAWTCAKCGDPVDLPLTRKAPRMVHKSGSCDGVLIQASVAEAARRASAFIGQNWRIYVENRGVGSSTPDSGPPIPITIERAQAFATPAQTVPTVLVQSYYTAFIIGFCPNDEAGDELKALGLRMGCGALGYRASQELTWAELSDTLLNEAPGYCQWVVLPEPVRQLRKRKKFNRLSALNLLPALVRENRTAEHYHPNLPQTRAQYLQDICADMQAQNWARWVHALMLSRGWRQSWLENFDEHPIQVPYFWLRYWLIKRSLHSKGNLIDPEILAVELAQSWSAQDDPKVIDALTDALADTLLQLELRGLVERVSGRYRCKKSLKKGY